MDYTDLDFIMFYSSFGSNTSDATTSKSIG